MGRNLDVGREVPDAAPGDDGAVEKTCYGNDTESCRVYGGLYTWTEAMQGARDPAVEGICPAGWHASHAGRVAGAGRAPRPRHRGRGAEGPRGPRPALRRNRRGGLHRPARRVGLPGLLRTAGPLGALLDVDRGERGARGVGPARPLLEPGPAALPQSGLRRLLPEGERVLRALREGRCVRREAGRGASDASAARREATSPVASSVSPPHGPRRPNILCITCEDISPRLGSYGDTVALTPVLDRLARSGVRFTRMFSVSGVCAPSRAALITGMYPSGIGADHMRTSSADRVGLPNYEAVPPPWVRPYTEYLRAAGYYTTNNSKTDYQFQSPITAWDANGRAAHWKNRPEGMPFFSIFNSTTTHESQVWDRADDPVIVPPERVLLPPYYPDTAKVRRDVARVYSNVAIMDREVGELLAELEEAGLADDTIVIWYSDHGGPHAPSEAAGPRLRAPRPVHHALPRRGARRDGQRRARELRGHPGDHPVPGRGEGARVHAGPALLGRAEGPAPRVRLRGPRPPGRAVRRGAGGARHALQVHPQLQARGLGLPGRVLPHADGDHAGAAPHARRGHPRPRPGPVVPPAEGAGKSSTTPWPTPTRCTTWRGIRPMPARSSA